MPEHYTKNTVSASAWCNKCGRATQHRIDSGRRGSCLVCLGKLTRTVDAGGSRPQACEATQLGLFVPEV